jgi:glucose/mannose transport system substrate-binding protein
LWYRTDLFEKAGVTAAPTTWDEFFAVAEQLKAAGIAGFLAAENEPGNSGHVFESVLLSVMGEEGYRGLFDGSVGWDDPRVTEALELMVKLYDYVNEDYLSTAWGDVSARFAADDSPAMIIMGDWTNGLLKSAGLTEFGWGAAPGTADWFLVLSDSFGLPTGARHRDNAINWLKVVGSKEGQDAFNPLKGSIPARTDADLALYDDYQHSAMADFANLVLVPSLQHGAAAKQSFLADYDLAINDLVVNKDVDKAQAMLVQAAQDAAFGQ